MVFVAIVLAVVAIYFLMRTKQRKPEIQIDNKRRTSKAERRMTPNIEGRTLSQKRRSQMETQKPIDTSQFVRGVEQRNFPAKSEYSQLGLVDWKLFTNKYILSLT